MFSLFATLFARLYYLQVVCGDAYHAGGRLAVAARDRRPAAARPDRRRPGPPAGRQPHVLGGLASTAPCSASSPTHEPRRRAEPAWPRAVDTRPAADPPGCWSPAATPGSVRRRLLERLAVPAGAGRRRRRPVRRAADPRAARGLPGASSPQQQSVRAYPRAVRHQPRPRARLPQPDHRRTSSTHADARTATPRVNGASHRRPRRRRAGVRPLAARHARLPAGRGRLDGPGARRRRRGAPASPATPWSPRSTPRCRASSSGSSADAITTARATYDPVTHRNYAADSGAAVVLEAKTGRVVAMASQPTYDPARLGRRHQQEAAGAALLRRRPATRCSAGRTQGQFAPGSTWKPFMTVGALNNGFTPDTRLDCSLGLPGRQPAGSRTTSPASYGYIDFAKALQISCDTFFYRVGLQLLAAATAPTRTTSTPGTRWSRRRRTSASASETGIDLPGEAGGRIADRHWKLAYWKSMKGYYCKIDARTPPAKRDFLHALRPRVLPRGQLLPRRRRGELRDRPGRHARHAAAAGPGLRRAVQRRHALRAADRQGDRQPRRHGPQADRARRCRRT